MVFSTSIPDVCMYVQVSTSTSTYMSLSTKCLPVCMCVECFLCALGEKKRKKKTLKPKKKGSTMKDSLRPWMNSNPDPSLQLFYS